MCESNDAFLLGAHRELKAVNVWFQNKRRSMKKKSIAWNRATALMSENAFGMGYRYFSTPANPSRQKSHLRPNTSLTLDTIVTSRERKESLVHARPPLTPRKNSSLRPAASSRRTHYMNSTDGSVCLWDHLLSSPPLPPSSPSKESDLLATLPPRARTLKSLEWACAKDRVGRKRKGTKQQMLENVKEENHDIPALDLDALPGDDTDTEDELITPESSMSMSIVTARSKSFERMTGGGTDPPAEDFEAAMALLGFKVNKSS